MKEETRRREVLENPLVKLKFQKMLKEMMAEKESKGGKKDKKKKKKKKRKGEESEKHKKEKVLFNIVLFLIFYLLSITRNFRK